jgi:signal transduction histidine kinase
MKKIMEFFVSLNLWVFASLREIIFVPLCLSAFFRSINGVINGVILLTVILPAAASGAAYFFIRQGEMDAAVVNAAGRQRMLIQKIAKHAYEIHYARKNVSAEMNGAVEEYELALAALERGGVVLMRGLLEKNRREWEPFRGQARILADMDSDGPKAEEALRYIQEKNRGLTALNDQITGALAGSLQQDVDEFKGRISLLLCGNAALFTLGFFLIRKRLLGPLKAISRSALEIAQGREELAPLPEYSGTELRQLVETLNRAMGFIRENADLRVKLDEERKFSGLQRRLAHIGDCVGKITHDMSNPLHILNLLLPGMKTLSEQCQANFNIPCRLHEKMEKAHVQVKRMKRMVGEILDLARGEGVKLNYGTVRFEDYLENVAAHLREIFSEKKIPCGIVLQSAFQGNVELDLERFGRIIENLVINAGNALSQKQGDVIEISSHEEDSMAVTIVSDNGPGVPSEIREALFSEGKPSMERKWPGYGLLICREMAELHGGSLDCSVSDKGSIFFVRIPKKRPKDLSTNNTN